MTDGQGGATRQCEGCGAPMGPERFSCLACGMVASLNSPMPQAVPPRSIPQAQGGSQQPGYPGPPRGAPVPEGPSPRGWIAPVVVVMLLVLVVGAGALLVTKNSSGDKGDGADSVVAETVPGATPEDLDVSFLANYCASPGGARDAIPAHVAGEPARSYVNIIGTDPGNFQNADGSSVPKAAGGSTVISPTTDGAFTADVSVLVRTRSVACVTFDSVRLQGDQCGPYGVAPDEGARLDASYDLGQSRWQVTIYELHGGEILHSGEIFPPSGGCPDLIFVSGNDNTVQQSLTDQMVLDWMRSHFVDGKPR